MKSLDDLNKCSMYDIEEKCIVEKEKEKEGDTYRLQFTDGQSVSYNKSQLGVDLAGKLDRVIDCQELGKRQRSEERSDKIPLSEKFFSNNKKTDTLEEYIDAYGVSKLSGGYAISLADKAGKNEGIHFFTKEALPKEMASVIESGLGGTGVEGWAQLGTLPLAQTGREILDFSDAPHEGWVKFWDAVPAYGFNWRQGGAVFQIGSLGHLQDQPRVLKESEKILARKFWDEVNNIPNLGGLMRCFFKLPVRVCSDNRERILDVGHAKLHEKDENFQPVLDYFLGNQDPNTRHFFMPSPSGTFVYQGTADPETAKKLAKEPGALEIHGEVEPGYEVLHADRSQDIPLLLPSEQKKIKATALKKVYQKMHAIPSLNRVAWESRVLCTPLAQVAEKWSPKKALALELTPYPLGGDRSFRCVTGKNMEAILKRRAAAPEGSVELFALDDTANTQKIAQVSDAQYFLGSKADAENWGKGKNVFQTSNLMNYFGHEITHGQYEVFVGGNELPLLAAKLDVYERWKEEKSSEKSRERKRKNKQNVQESKSEKYENIWKEWSEKPIDEANFVDGKEKLQAQLVQYLDSHAENSLARAYAAMTFASLCKDRKDLDEDIRYKGSKIPLLVKQKFALNKEMMDKDLSPIFSLTVGEVKDVWENYESRVGESEGQIGEDDLIDQLSKYLEDKAVDPLAEAYGGMLLVRAVTRRSEKEALLHSSIQENQGFPEYQGPKISGQTSMNATQSLIKQESSYATTPEKDSNDDLLRIYKELKDNASRIGLLPEQQIMFNQQLITNGLPPIFPSEVDVPDKSKTNLGSILSVKGKDHNKSSFPIGEGDLEGDVKFETVRGGQLRDSNIAPPPLLDEQRGVGR